ncbi:MAG: hypothetical protein ACJ78Q_08005 [Chloroflexia bacterium]
MLKPRTPIRRFDVFAEYNRQKAIKEGTPEDEAAGYGLWVAKVVASRRFGGGLSQKPRHAGDGAAEDEGEREGAEKPKWHELNGKPQTDELFHDEIVRRMGQEFYDKVFEPAIRQAVEEDRTYTSIRDTLRKDWKPGGAA